jgi:lipopolysaccharide transport system permease protein
MRLIEKGSLSKINFSEIYKYRYFIYNVFYRNITVIFKQTAFGYLWRILIPILQSGLIAVVFSGIANMATDEIHPFMFYYSGMIVWILFQNNITKVSDIFLNYSHFLRNIYVPKLCFPIAIMLENIFIFSINFISFIIIYLLFIFKGNSVDFNFQIIVFLPIIILYISLLGMIFGLITALLSAKFRDLRFIVQNTMQVFFYGTPIVYSINTIPENYHFIFLLNPIVFLVDYFRNLFFSVSNVGYNYIFSSIIITIILSLIVVYLFKKISGNIVDNV